MPELPEVETVARDLRPRIVGATIAGAWVGWPRTLRAGDEAEFARAVTGRRIEAVGRRAKLVVDLSGGAALTIHLKMTGQLFVVPADTPVDPYARLGITFTDGRELRFRDIRKFGRVGFHVRDGASGELVDEAGGRATFAGFGPEPLAPEFTLARFRRLIRARRGRLKPLLLDQSFLAGVGNIYADEALWAARLHPLRSAGSLRPADERRLYLAVRSILTEAIERRGSSIDDYTAPDGDGEMQERLQVYQRTGEPCPRCGPAGPADRHRCPLDPFLFVVPAAFARGPSIREGDPPRRDRRVPTTRTPLDRTGGGGDAGSDAGRGRAGRRAGTDGRHERAAVTRRARARDAATAGGH